jgi:hypothetical protein
MKLHELWAIEGVAQATPYIFGPNLFTKRPSNRP